MGYLRTLNYSSANEDGRSEITALALGHDDSVLCITGSGARPLDLLVCRPASVVSIDFNPCQNFLLELKMRAIERLEHGEFLAFVGVRSSARRLEVYREVRRSLSPDGRAFWDRHSGMIRRGVIYGGRWERYFRRQAGLVRMIRPRLHRRLFNCRTVQEQTRLWSEEWDSLGWRAFLRCASSRLVTRHAYGDPGFYSQVPLGFSVYRYYRQRLASAVENFLLSDSPFATLLFHGQYNEDGPFPVHLRAESYEAVRAGVQRVRMVTAPLSQYLEHCVTGRFQAYSLSDVTSYIDRATHERIWREIVRTASNGARVCERQFLAKPEIPEACRGTVRRVPSLERALGARDDSIFYSFLVALVRRN